MALRKKPPTERQRVVMPRAEVQTKAGGNTSSATNRAKQAWNWLLKRLDVTYLVGWVLIVVGATIFFAAQGTVWLQGAGGVVVGTGFTVLVTTITGRRAIHEQYAKEANLRRKNELYGPLYTELKNLREALQKAHNDGGLYPQRIGIGNSAFADDPMTPPGYEVPTLLQWPAFKRGYYWSDFTDSARQILDRLIDLAETYNQAVHDVQDPAIQILASEIEQAIRQTKASSEYISWHKQYPTETSWYDALSKGTAQHSWFRYLEFVPPQNVSQGHALASSWIMSWPIQHEPPTLGCLLAGNAALAARAIHAGYLSNSDPKPPIEWIEDIFKNTVSELQIQHSYREAHAVHDQLYAIVHQAEQRVLTALNDIQRRYEGGRPPL